MQEFMPRKKGQGFADWGDSTRDAGSSLFGDSESIIELPLDQVAPSPYQPRKRFDEEGLRSLGESLKEYGQLDPILVYEIAGEEGYFIIAGERRYRAAQVAGLSTIKAVVRSEDSAREVALVSNAQRQDLTPLEEAEAYQRLIDEYGMTHGQIGEKVGKSRTRIAKIVGLTRLDEAIKDDLHAGRYDQEPTTELLIEIASAQPSEQREHWEAFKAGEIQTRREARTKKQGRGERTSLQQVKASLRAATSLVKHLEGMPEKVIAAESAEHKALLETSEALQRQIERVTRVIPRSKGDDK